MEENRTEGTGGRRELQEHQTTTSHTAGQFFLLRADFNFQLMFLSFMFHLQHQNLFFLLEGSFLHRNR